MTGAIFIQQTSMSLIMNNFSVAKLIQSYQINALGQKKVICTTGTYLFYAL